MNPWRDMLCSIRSFKIERISKCPLKISTQGISWQAIAKGRRWKQSSWWCWTCCDPRKGLNMCNDRCNQRITQRELVKSLLHNTNQNKTITARENSKHLK